MKEKEDIHVQYRQCFIIDNRLEDKRFLPYCTYEFHFSEYKSSKHIKFLMMNAIIENKRSCLAGSGSITRFCLTQWFEILSEIGTNFYEKTLCNKKILGKVAHVGITKSTVQLTKGVRVTACSFPIARWPINSMCKHTFG